MITTDEAAITAIPQRFMEAWAAHDAAALARLFTVYGTLVLPGVHLKGNAAIRAYLARAFANELKGMWVTGEQVDLRYTGSLALLGTRGGVSAAGEPAPERAIPARWVIVKAAGEWRLAAYQNSAR